MEKKVRSLRIAVFIFIFFQAAVCPAAPHQGPLEVINQFPPHMIFLTPRPHSPQLLGKNGFEGAVAVDYFSIYANAAASSQRILMDMEATVVDFRLAYGLSDRCDFFLRVPWVSMNGGFLDEPLEIFHDTFGLPNYGKEKSPDNAFTYVMRKDGQSWFDSQEGGVHLTDLTMALKINLFSSKISFPMDASLTYEIKAPSGDAAYGFGSGAWDHGLFFPIKYAFKRLDTYLMPGYVWVAAPQFETVDIPVKDIFSMFIGVQYPYSPRTHLIAQVNAYTSPFRHTGIEKLDAPSVELSLGLKRALTSQVGVEFAFCEDLTRGAPDFNLHFRLNFIVP